MNALLLLTGALDNIVNAPRCFSTAVKWFICFKMKFQFQHMIFNTSQRTVNLNAACVVVKIMLEKLKIIVLEMKCQIDVD